MCKGVISMKMIVKILRFVYLPLCGLLVIPVSFSFASGFISEYGPESPMFPTPLWFIPGGVFLLGFVIQFWRKYFWLGIGLTLFSIILFFLPIPYLAIRL